MKQKLKTKDLIYAGAFAALYIIALFIIVMGFGMIPILYLMAPLFVGIICATIYMTYVTKVKKFGAILILAILFGLVMSAGGHGLTVLICIPFGLVAELIAKAGGYQSKKMFSLSYIVFNITMVAPFYNLYFTSDKFIAECVEYYGQAYGDAIANVLNTYGLGFMGIQVILAVVGAAIGTVVAAKLFKKHFAKAGLV